MDITSKFEHLASLSDFLCRRRKMNIVRAVFDTAHMPGAIIEAGCNGGGTSLIIQFLIEAMNLQKEFHVYDSFEGLNGKCEKDGDDELFLDGQWPVSVEHFVHVFEEHGLRLPTIHKGLVQKLGPTDFPRQISMAFLDLDFYAPTKCVLQQIWHRVPIGGIIVLDDYNFSPLPGITRVVEEFFENVKVDTSTPITGTIRKGTTSSLRWGL